MPARGRLITFEGGEGTGKSTLVDSLAADLREQGWAVLATREPGGTPLGSQIRQARYGRSRTRADRNDRTLALSGRSSAARG